MGGARAQRTQRPANSRRALESNIARAASLRNIRRASAPASNQRIESRSAQDVTIEIMRTYLDTSGTAGTVGKAGNPGQAIGGAIEDLAKLLKKVSDKANPEPAATMREEEGLTNAYAVVTKLPSSLYDDSIKAAALHNTWDRISWEWEQSLVKGTYNLVRCVDFGQTTSQGSYYLVVGIATDPFYLQKFIADVSDPNLKIQPWKTIEGKAPWPTPPRNAPAGPREKTIRQG